tara:strand:+ start:4262 stop:4867 length:606 start_codon:yes stop_codon:yes gene_type:complete
MEMEDMQRTWNQLGKRITEQEISNTELISKMTQQNYVSKLNKIGYSEYIGSVICYLAAVYLLWNISKINGMPTQILALIVISLLCILPIISLRSLRALKNSNIAAKTHKEAIYDFGKRKLLFQKLQRLNASLGFFLLLIGIPVLSAIRGVDINEVPNFWTLIFPSSIAFFLLFSLWVLRSYNRVLDKTEKMLSDLNDHENV